MPKLWRRALLALSMIVLGATFGVSEVDFLPESTTPQTTTPAPAAIPMSTIDIKSLAKSRSPAHDTILLDSTVRASGEIAIRFKALSIEGDEEDGIIVRYLDPKNYYVITANTNSDSCSLYRMKDGKWKTIDTQNAIITPLLWHELHVTFVDDRFTAIVDKDPVLGVKDSSIKKAGQIGLWIKAGASMGVDNFRVSHP